MATFERGNGKIVQREYDMLVGADGVNSRVRRALEETVPDFTVREVEVLASGFLGEITFQVTILCVMFLFLCFSAAYIKKYEGAMVYCSRAMFVLLSGIGAVIVEQVVRLDMYSTLKYCT